MSVESYFSMPIEGCISSIKSLREKFLKDISVLDPSDQFIKIQDNISFLDPTHEFIKLVGTPILLESVNLSKCLQFTVQGTMPYTEDVFTNDEWGNLYNKFKKYTHFYYWIMENGIGIDYNPHVEISNRCYLEFITAHLCITFIIFIKLENKECVVCLNVLQKKALNRL